MTRLRYEQLLSRRRRPGARGFVFQTLRISVLGVILFLMHWQHQRWLSAQRGAELEAVPLETVQELFPDAIELGEATSDGGRLVLGSEEPIGKVIQTAPESREFLGFSGPTNVLIGLDPQNKIIGLRILDSQDTRDHVQLIRENTRFLSSLNGKSVEEAKSARVDAVSGATLTSLAIVQGIQARLGQSSASLKFPDPLSVEDARRFFSNAADVRRDSRLLELWHVIDSADRPIGILLSNSPVADHVIGYQGPTRAFLAVSESGKILGLKLKESFDNDPYVGYVRGDAWFAEILNDSTVGDISQTSFEEAGIEGVSGATMTSQAVAEGLFQAAQKLQSFREHQRNERKHIQTGRWRLVATLSLLAIAVVMGFSHLRGVGWFRFLFQLTVIAAIGLMNADLLSMAMFVGWAQSGVPWNNAVGLVCLSAAAIALPIATGTNIYCDHMCPHGALQQLLPRRWKLSRHPRWLVALLKPIRPILLGVVVVVPLLHWPLSLVDIEPFDAYSWRAAGMATTVIAVGGLLLSLFLPMGYCRYGCPTGAVLGYLRRHSQSGQLCAADAVSGILLLIAIVCVNL